MKIFKELYLPIILAQNVNKTVRNVLTGTLLSSDVFCPADSLTFLNLSNQNEFQAPSFTACGKSLYGELLLTKFRTKGNLRTCPEIVRKSLRFFLSKFFKTIIQNHFSCWSIRKKICVRTNQMSRFQFRCLSASVAETQLPSQKRAKT